MSFFKTTDWDSLPQLEYWRKEICGIANAKLENVGAGMKKTLVIFEQGEKHHMGTVHAKKQWNEHPALEIFRNMDIPELVSICHFFGYSIEFGVVPKTCKIKDKKASRGKHEQKVKAKKTSKKHKSQRSS